MNSLVPCGNRFKRPMLWRISTASFDAGRKPKRRSPARSPRSLCCLGLSPVPSIYSSARTELDESPVCRHYAGMISSFVRALVSAFKARRELRVRGYVAWLRSGQCVRITNSKQRKHLSPSARCDPVNGLAGCYVSTIGTPHEYFDLCLLFIHPCARNLISLRSAGTVPA